MKHRNKIHQGISLVPCHQCKELKPSHTICRACGAYSANYSLKKKTVAPKAAKGKKEVKEEKKEAHHVELAKSKAKQEGTAAKQSTTKGTFFRRKSGEA